MWSFLFWLLAPMYMTDAEFFSMAGVWGLGIIVCLLLGIGGMILFYIVAISQLFAGNFVEHHSILVVIVCSIILIGLCYYLYKSDMSDTTLLQEILQAYFG